MRTLEQEVAELLLGGSANNEHWDAALETAEKIILLVGRRLEDEWAEEPEQPDWHIAAIAENFTEEVDCNSGKRRRVYRDERI